MIREANTSDIPRIVELGTRSLKDGPYKDICKDNPEQSARFALAVIDKMGKVLVYEVDGEIHGLLGFIISPHYFSAELVASEVMWYVEQEHRVAVNGYFPAFDLLKAAEKLASELGAVKMAFTAPTKEVGTMYERFGYRPIEVGYLKELACHS